MRRMAIWSLAAAIVAVPLGLLVRQRAGVAANISTRQSPASEAITQGAGISEGHSGGAEVWPGHDALAQSAPTVEAGGDSPAARQEAYVNRRVTELLDLGRMADADSLEAIVSELTNRDPRIRKAAMEAAKQFGSRDAIPKLAEAVLQTDDPREKVDLLDAIEFLKLPTLTQAVAR